MPEDGDSSALPQNARVATTSTCPGAPSVIDEVGRDPETGLPPAANVRVRERELVVVERVAGRARSAVVAPATVTSVPASVRPARRARRRRGGRARVVLVHRDLDLATLLHVAGRVDARDRAVLVGRVRDRAVDARRPRRTRPSSAATSSNGLPDVVVGRRSRPCRRSASCSASGVDDWRVRVGRRRGRVRPQREDDDDRDQRDGEHRDDGDERPGPRVAALLARCRSRRCGVKPASPG